MMEWFRKLRAPSLTTELMDICKELLPEEGTVYITVPNGFTFKMTNMVHKSGHQTYHVWAHIENPKNGVTTDIWKNHCGFINPLCEENTFLIKWFYEAVQQLHISMYNHRRAKEREYSELVCELLGMWENRHKGREEYRAMG